MIQPTDTIGSIVIVALFAVFGGAAVEILRKVGA